MESNKGFQKIISGKHAILEYLKQNRGGILYISQERDTTKRIEEIKNAAVSKGLQITRLSEQELKEMCNDDPRGVCLSVKSETKKRSIKSLKDLITNLDSDNSLVLLLDGITDPHNYGAILRSAEQFGADLVIVPRKKSSGRTQVVGKTSAGAVHHLDILEVSNLKYAVKDLQAGGFWVYGAQIGGRSVHQTKFSGRTALVMGSEGKGISRLLEEYIDHLVAIPTMGKIDSLNVSVAAGILLYEIRRQQKSI